MPSYRVIMTVGALRPGASPESIVPAAADAVAEFATVEAKQLGVVSGEARVTVRFTEDDDDVAVQIGEHAVRALDARIQVVAWRVTRRRGGTWPVVAAG